LLKRQGADVLENPNFVYSVLRSHQDFQTLATFTLMSGLRDIQKKKANRAGTSSPLLASPSPPTSSLFSYLPLISCPHEKTWLPYADSIAVEAKKDAPKGLQRTNSEMEMIAEKAALLSTHDQEEDIPRLTSDQPSPMDEIRDPGLSIITPGENNVDPLSLSTSTSTKMSEKARGKMRAVDPSTLDGEDGMGMVDVGDEELLGIAAAGVGPSGYVPTQEWVSSWQKGYVFSVSSFLLFFHALRVPSTITFGSHPTLHLIRITSNSTPPTP